MRPYVWPRSLAARTTLVLVVALAVVQALGLWMFTVRTELKARGELERVREWLPVYFDPTRREAMFGPGAELANPPMSSEKGAETGRPLRQIAG